MLFSQLFLTPLLAEYNSTEFEILLLFGSLSHSNPFSTKRERAGGNDTTCSYHRPPPFHPICNTHTNTMFRLLKNTAPQQRLQLLFTVCSKVFNCELQHEGADDFVTFSASSLLSVWKMIKKETSKEIYIQNHNPNFAFM